MNPQYRNAIGTVESSNNYGALGPVTKSGDRAYGRYQVMGANIPEWTRKHLGEEYTPEEFLADKEAQDKVFDAVTGSYHKKYGNLDDVTSSWFSGRPRAQAGSASDGYNTVPQYLSKVNAVMGDGSGVDAINSAAGIKPAAGMGALTSAFAKTDDEKPALSADTVLGPGALSAEPNKADVIGRGLSGIGASLAGISNPDQAKAITAQMVANQKTPTDQGTWSHTVTPDGKLMLMNSKRPMPIFVPGNFAKPEKDAGEEETKKLEAKAAMEKYTATQDASNTADEQLRSIKELRKAASNPNVKFGGAGDITATAKNILYSMGVPVEGLDDTQAVQRIATQMQLAKGKLLPGAISNYEDKLMGMANGLGLDKGREANMAALDALEKIALHQKALASEAVKYKEKNGKLDDGWDRYRSQFAPKEDVAPPAPTVTAPRLPTGVRGITVFKP